MMINNYGKRTPKHPWSIGEWAMKMFLLQIPTFLLEILTFLLQTTTFFYVCIQKPGVFWSFTLSEPWNFGDNTQNLDLFWCFCIEKEHKSCHWRLRGMREAHEICLEDKVTSQQENTNIWACARFIGHLDGCEYDHFLRTKHHVNVQFWRQNPSRQKVWLKWPIFLIFKGG